jgi:hypothetical protein
VALQQVLRDPADARTAVESPLVAWAAGHLEFSVIWNFRSFSGTKPFITLDP